MFNPYGAGAGAAGSGLISTGLSGLFNVIGSPQRAVNSALMSAIDQYTGRGSRPPTGGGMFPPANEMSNDIMRSFDDSKMSYLMDRPKQQLGKSFGYTNESPMTVPGSPGSPGTPEGSYIPMLAGLAAGGLSALVPGMAAFSPWIGAGAAGLTQMGLNAYDPNTFKNISTGDVINRVAPGYGDEEWSTLPLRLSVGMATDPLMWAGGITGGTKLGQPTVAEQGLARTMVNDATSAANYKPIPTTAPSAQGFSGFPQSQLDELIGAARGASAPQSPLSMLGRDLSRMNPAAAESVPGGISAVAESRLGSPFASTTGKVNLSPASQKIAAEAAMREEMMSRMAAQTDESLATLSKPLQDIASRRSIPIMEKYPMPQPPPPPPAQAPPMQAFPEPFAMGQGGMPPGGPVAPGPVAGNIDVMRPWLEAGTGPEALRRINPRLAEIVESYGLGAQQGGNMMAFPRGLPNPLELRGGWATAPSGMPLRPAMGNEGLLNLLVNG